MPSRKKLPQPPSNVVRLHNRNAPKPPPELERWYELQLENSALDSAAAARARFVVTWEGLVIPYFDPYSCAPTEDDNGAPFQRIRLHKPRSKLRKNGSRITQKYAQAKDSGTHVFYPFADDPKVGWRAALETQLQQLIIVESEKAALSIKANFPQLWPIAIGGVNNWGGQGRLKHELEALVKNRSVVVMFDSDKNTKPGVLRAEQQLVAAAEAAGADAYVIDIPPPMPGDVDAGGNGVTKLGPDDLLAIRGDAAFAALIAQAKAGERALWVKSLNEHYALDMSTRRVIDLDRPTHSQIPMNVFDYHAGTFVKVIMHDARLKELLPSRDWIRDPHSQKVEYSEFNPELSSGVTTSEGVKIYNTWRGLPFAPVKGDVQPMLNALDFTIVDKASREYFIRWVACIVQRPGVKMNHFIQLSSRTQGTGKSLILNFLAELFGHSLVLMCNTNIINSRFNSGLHGKLLVLMEESENMHYNNYPAIEGRAWLKNFTTSKHTQYESKGVDARTSRNYANLILTSNAALRIEQTDRRPALLDCDPGKAMPSELARAFANWYEDPRTRNAVKPALQAAMYYFLRVQVPPEFETTAPPHTELRAEAEEDAVSLQEALQASMEEWLRDVQSGELELILWRDQISARDIYTMDEIYDLARKTGVSLEDKRDQHLFGKIVRHGTAKLDTMKVSGRVHRFVILRNADKWKEASNADIRKHLQQTMSQDYTIPRRKYC
jgi:hypothetical protein